MLQTYQRGLLLVINLSIVGLDSEELSHMSTTPEWKAEKEEPISPQVRL